MSSQTSEQLPGSNAVTVVIAVKDAEDTIGRAVATALAQPEALQVIVVDDGSTDQTGDAAKSACDGTGRLEIIRFEKNKGPAAARNAALDIAKGEWYTMLDSDDFMDEGRIGCLLDIAGDQYDFVADDLWLVPEGQEDGARDKMWNAPPESQRCPLTFEMFLDGNIAHKDRERRELGFIKPIIRRSVIERMGLRYREHMRLSEDLIFYSEILLETDAALLVEPQGYIAVRRPDSLSARHGTEELRHYYEAIISLGKRPDLTPAQRHVTNRFRNSVSRRYRWSKLIDARRSKNIGEAISAFATSPDIIALLIRNSMESIIGKLSPSATR